MNRAQQNQKIIDDALKNQPEARLCREAVRRKMAKWIPEGESEHWANELFKRLWLRYIIGYSTAPFKEICCQVLRPRFKGFSEGKIYPWNGSRIDNCLSINLGIESPRFCWSGTENELEELIEDWNEAYNKGIGKYTEDPRVPISDWILEKHRAGEIDWHRRDKEYWKVIFRRVEEETVLPPKWEHPMTHRRKVRHWEYFKSILIEESGAYGRHIPQGWYGPPEDRGKKRLAPAADWVKRARYLFRVVKDAPGARRGDDPVEDYGKLVGLALNRHINKMLKDVNDPCIDNIRFAAKDKAGDMKRYLVRRRGGC